MKEIPLHSLQYKKKFHWIDNKYIQLTTYIPNILIAFIIKTNQIVLLPLSQKYIFKPSESQALVDRIWSATKLCSFKSMNVGDDGS